MSEVVSSPVQIQDVAEALLARNDLRLRLLMQVWFRTKPNFTVVPYPQTDDLRILAASAALIEAFALQVHQVPPDWVATIGALPEPFFAVDWAERPGFTRDLCLTQSPEAFKRHNIFAPPNFLHMV